MKLALLIFSFALSSPAFAASEFMHQTPADKIEVTGALEYLKMTSEVKASPTISVDSKGLREWVRAEYGLSEMFSAGLDLSMASYTTDKIPPGTRATTQSGMWDPTAFFHGVSAMGPGALRYGVDLNFALGKNETKANGDTNWASGGLGAQPFVGYEMGKDNCLMGARLAYWLGVSDTKESITNAAGTKTNYTNTGGEQLTLSFFYEHKFKPMLLGVALSLIDEKQTDRKTGGTTTQKEAPHDEYQLQVYAPYEINEMITLLPAITYAKYNAMDNTSFDSVNYWKVFVGGRFAF